MHTTHGVGHAVRGGAGGHVVGMQGTAGAAAGSDGEILLTSLDALLLVGTCDGMLEAGGVGGVAGDGNIHALMPHDGHAFAHIIRAVAANLRTLAVGIRGLIDDGQRVIFLDVGREVVILGLHIGKAVDAADDHGSVLAKTVEDDAQRGLADLVGVAGDADRALSSGKRLMTGQEREAFGLLVQQHGAQVAVAQTNLTLVGNGTGDAERLEAFADALGSLGSGLDALLQRDGGAQLVGPLRVFKGDGLDALDDLVGVNALGVVVGLQLIKILEAVLLENRLELGHATFITFKKSH